MKTHLLVFVFVTLSLCSGCSWLGFGSSESEKPAYELVQDGMAEYENGRYNAAIKNFEQLKDWYPFSKYAILAELKIADANYHLKSYAEAIQAYEEFEQLHPRNEATPYVIYQIGRCYYEQIDSIDRDQTPAHKALEVFRRLKQQYPNDPYTHRSQTHITKCLQNIAGHEFYVGRFYFKSKHYKAALSRFMSVVTQYPDVGVHHQALTYIAQCEAIIALQTEKESTTTR
ncbi:MAG: outer membrane protein assembly factor BamD [Desulfobacteraceae bacterium]|jgi:outer membrane protein assembly factor BamD